MYFSDLAAALKAHRSYFLASLRHWDPHFRPIKRSNILRSYLGLLLNSLRKGTYTPAIVDREATTPTMTASASHLSPTRGSAHSDEGASRSPRPNVAVPSTAWRQEVQQVERIYEQLLRSSIANRFPRAGEINKPLLDFVDRVTEGWELAGRRAEDAPEAVEVGPAPQMAICHLRRSSFIA
jgi:cargo-transport protein YPP1